MSENITESPVTKLVFALVYAQDSKRSIAFYTKYFGFVIDPELHMEGDQVYGQMGPVSLWIGGGHAKAMGNEKTTRVTPMLGVKSAGQLFGVLKAGGVTLYQEYPVQMNETSHWFQFADPDGNVWDVLGNP